MQQVSQEHIEIVEGAGGPKARIAGSRIRVEDVAVWHEKLGMPAGQIVDQYPQLSLADIYAALAYYWDHREEIERAMAEEDAVIETIRNAGPGPLAEKLKRLRRE